MQDCLEADREFGVVLIERGHEVGGGEVRTQVGTRARIVEAVELDDGRWALGTMGVGRLRVARWLDDDPYPRADVDDWPDDRWADPAHPETAVAPVLGHLRRVLATAAELGDRVVDSTIELADEVELASLQMAAVAPLGPADQQRLLAAPSTGARLALLDGLLDELEADLVAG